MNSFHPSPRLLACAALALLAGSTGCQLTGDFATKVTAADGVSVEVPLTQAKLDVTDGTVDVTRFQYVPKAMDDGAKGVVMNFEARFSGPARPASIIVEDITDQPILLVLNDPHPRMVKDTHWIGVTTPTLPSNDRYRFLANLDNSIQIYRFTFTLVDGSVHILRVPVVVPNDMKTFMRTQLGI